MRTCADDEQLKELEKLGPKMKGIGDISFHGFCGAYYSFFFNFFCFVIVSQSVKEVLQSLVDDNLVQMDKIGSSNCRCASGFALSINHPWSYFQTSCACRRPVLGSLLELPFSEGCDREFLCHCHAAGGYIYNNPLTPLALTPLALTLRELTEINSI